MSVITIDTSALVNGAKRFENMSKELAETVDNVLDGNVEEMAEKTKQNAATQALSGYGHLLMPSISADISKPLRKEVTVGVGYAGFVEFGTGVYAAQYVASLPTDWQQFAAQFRGSGGKRSIKAILFFLTNWFHAKGINDKQHAFFIARKIFLNGTRAHPFLFPAYRDQLPQLREDLENALKAFGK